MEINPEIKKVGEEMEVTKEQFKELYFKYALPHSGWTQDYWDQFYEKAEGKRYFFTKPASPEHTSMFISDGKNDSRMYFLTDEATESFYDFPGKE